MGREMFTRFIIYFYLEVVHDGGGCFCREVENGFDGLMV